MKDILEYSKSNVSLKEREDFLFDLIDMLDKESSKLFGEIIDLSSESFYKANDISSRIVELHKVYIKAQEAYDYLDKLEQSKVVSATKRMQFKSLLVGITTMFAFVSNAFLGIASFVLLNSKATNDFSSEHEEIEGSYAKFDDDRMELIKRTIENCSRLYNGKVYKMNEILKSAYSSHDKDCCCAIVANKFLELYLMGVIPKSRLFELNKTLKSKVLSILLKDLNCDNDDFSYLLDLVKTRSDESKELVKKLGNS